MGCDFPAQRYSFVVGEISIHASRMGCDHRTNHPRTVHYNEFQSTHPVWDATFLLALTSGMRKGISIHASRMGCDVLAGTYVRDEKRDFNPRIPYGMRHVLPLAGPVILHQFQSTHPVWDATPSRPKLSAHHRFQSTHPVWDATAPSGGRRRPSVKRHFNPRIPYGMRRASCRCGRTRGYFNPRIPYGMRLPPQNQRYRTGYFNPRIPYGMRPRLASAALFRCTDFNPRIPYGMRRASATHAPHTCHRISIHASRMGCDARV